MSEAQRETIAFLTDPATHGGAAVERIDTHGAVVVLTPTQAFKLKRAVAFSYMDFSTTALRRAACFAELRLNRRTAPQIYESVRAIVRRGGILALVDGDDPAAAGALDWVVVMRRFDDATQFDRLAAAGRLDLALVRRLAGVVARFHRAESAVFEFGGADGIARVIDENQREMAHQESILAPARAADIDRGCRAAFVAVAALLDQRRSDGHVRRCHGDLHLGNICLVDNQPTLFDAIEFNDDIATIDTLFDLAFLLMDLEARVSREHANVALNAYLELIPGIAGLAVLPLFLVLRAVIRAHTRAAAAQAQRDMQHRTAMIADAQRHLDWAASLLVTTPPRLVAVGGVSGSGKSTMARGLAPGLGNAPGAVILRSDVVRKELAGVEPTVALPASAYTPEQSARVYAALNARAAAVLAVGLPIVVDAVFLRTHERDAIAGVASAAGVRFDGIWLEPDRDTAARRIKSRRDDASDATAAVLEMQLGAAPAPPRGWHVIDARGEPSQVLSRIGMAMS